MNTHQFTTLAHSLSFHFSSELDDFFTWGNTVVCCITTFRSRMDQPQQPSPIFLALGTCPFSHWPLTSCCMAWFLTGWGLVPDSSPQVGDSCGTRSIKWVRNSNKRQCVTLGHKQSTVGVKGENEYSLPIWG